MPGGGLSAVWEIAARLPRTKIAMLTVSGEDADLFAALRAGAEGYLLKTMNSAQLPSALDGVRSGEAAIRPVLVARLLNRFRTREPRMRRPLDHKSAGAPDEPRVGGTRAARTATFDRRDRLGLAIQPVRCRSHYRIVRKLHVADRAAAGDLFAGAQTPKRPIAAGALGSPAPAGSGITGGNIAAGDMNFLMILR